MADERKIVIELKVNGSGGNVTRSSGNTEEENLTDVLKTIQHPIKTLEKNVFGKNILAYEAYNQAKTTIKKTAFYVAEKYFNLTENYKAEQDLENVMSVIEHVSGIGASVLGGAIIGTKVAPGIGTAIGAGVGLISAAINTGIDAVKAWDRQHMQLTAMNIQSSFQMTKLGLIDNGRGTLY